MVRVAFRCGTWNERIPWADGDDNDDVDDNYRYVQTTAANQRE